MDSVKKVNGELSAGDTENAQSTLRILVIAPPSVPSYFNAGHHLPVFEVSAYLRRLPTPLVVKAIDASALSVTWKDVADLLVNQHFNIIAIMNDFDTLDGFARFVHYARALSRTSYLITFGRLSQQIPAFFERYDLDAIVTSGDYEAGVAGYIQWLSQVQGNPPGIAIRRGVGWEQPSQNGLMLSPDEWVLPDIDEIPYAAYDRLYLRDQNKFCGIPERRELVVPVARGCPIRCFFCEVWRREGLRERRLPVSRVLSYIEEAFSSAPFEYVSMYAPTFTLNKKWVKELCNELIIRGARYPWKCSTTLHHLDEALVELMAQSGCIRISVGLETLDPGGRDTLPQIKQVEGERFEAISSWCQQSGIELNCLVIVGLPGTTVEGAKYTMAYVREKGARVRPTIYTPYDQLRPEMDEGDVIAFNRQLFTNAASLGDSAELYQLVFSEEPTSTRVMEMIPRKLMLHGVG